MTVVTTANLQTTSLSEAVAKTEALLGPDTSFGAIQFLALGLRLLSQDELTQSAVLSLAALSVPALAGRVLERFELDSPEIAMAQSLVRSTPEVRVEAAASVRRVLSQLRFAAPWQPEIPLQREFEPEAWGLTLN